MSELSAYSDWIIGGAIALIAIGVKTFWPSRKQKQAEIKKTLNIQPQSVTEAPAPTPAKGSNWWQALAKTRSIFSVSANGEIEALREAFEEACLLSDLGVQNTQEALDQVDWQQVQTLPQDEQSSGAQTKLQEIISPWLQSTQSANNWPQNLIPSGEEKYPVVIWFVGVNGVGKTTSIAKLAAEIKNSGHTALLACGDTFRAAASDQLESWAERLGIPAVKGAVGSDSSAVLFDAITSAKAKKIDFVLCDSAGRLHNQSQLMEALAKNKRVMEKALPGAPHEVLLVLDANTGQNMVRQAEEFLAAVSVTGLVLSKLDGTARGGAIVAVARKTGLPIRRLGLGESVEDFVAFDPKAFTQALLGTGEIAQKQTPAS